MQARATDAQVRHVLVAATDLASARRGTELAERYPGWGAAVGVHPHDCADFDRATSAQLRELAAHPKAAAIGETGLDFHRQRQPRDQQERAFRAQIELALELDLPLVVHSRESLDRIGAVLEGYPDLRGVMHSFTGTAEEAERFVALGMHISISGIVTFRNAAQVRATAASVAAERLLLETDAPFLSPHPRRGRRNEPAHLPYTADAVASARGVSVTSLSEVTTRNARILFGAF